jgi:hypothetical protein
MDEPAKARREKREIDDGRDAGKRPRAVVARKRILQVNTGFMDCKYGL